jgi:hypothetical protein
MKEPLKNSRKSKPCKVTIDGVTTQKDSIKAACDFAGIEYVNIARKLKNGSCEVTTVSNKVIRLEVCNG